MDEAYRLRREGLDLVLPIFRTLTDRRVKGPANRGINMLASTDPNHLFTTFPQLSDAIQSGNGRDLLKILQKTEKADTTLGSFGSKVKGLQWHHMHMGLSEMGTQSRNLNPTAFQSLTQRAADEGAYFGQNSQQMRIQATPTHVADGNKGWQHLTSHASGKSPQRLPIWTSETTGKQAWEDAKPIVQSNEQASRFAESLYPHKETERRLTEALDGQNPLINQADLTPDQRKEIGKRLYDRGFKAFSPAEMKEWIKKHHDDLSKLKPKHLAAMGLALPGWLGAPVSAAETGQRAKKSWEDKDALQFLQAGLSAVSTVGDFVGPAGEVVSSPADGLNVAIDHWRERGKRKPTGPNPLHIHTKDNPVTIKPNKKRQNCKINRRGRKVCK